MGYLIFTVGVSIAYVAGMVVLVREMRASTAEERRENQSIPLILAATLAYGVIIGKTHQLAQMCGWV